MFKNLKQKIAEGVEGVTPGRQTSLQQTTPTKRNDDSLPSTPSTSSQASEVYFSQLKVAILYASLKNANAVACI